MGAMWEREASKGPDACAESENGDDDSDAMCTVAASLNEESDNFEEAIKPELDVSLGSSKKWKSHRSDGRDSSGRRAAVRHVDEDVTQETAERLKGATAKCTDASLAGHGSERIRSSEADLSELHSAEKRVVEHSAERKVDVEPDLKLDSRTRHLQMISQRPAVVKLLFEVFHHFLDPEIRTMDWSKIRDFADSPPAISFLLDAGFEVSVEKQQLVFDQKNIQLLFDANNALEMKQRATSDALVNDCAVETGIAAQMRKVSTDASASALAPKTGGECLSDCCESSSTLQSHMRALPEKRELKADMQNALASIDAAFERLRDCDSGCEARFLLLKARTKLLTSSRPLVADSNAEMGVAKVATGRALKAEIECVEKEKGVATQKRKVIGSRASAFVPEVDDDMDIEVDTSAQMSSAVHILSDDNLVMNDSKTDCNEKLKCPFSLTHLRAKAKKPKRRGAPKAGYGSVRVLKPHSVGKAKSSSDSGSDDLSDSPLALRVPSSDAVMRGMAVEKIVAEKKHVDEDFSKKNMSSTPKVCAARSPVIADDAAEMSDDMPQFWGSHGMSDSETDSSEEQKNVELCMDAPIGLPFGDGSVGSRSKLVVSSSTSQMIVSEKKPVAEDSVHGDGSCEGHSQTGGYYSSEEQKGVEISSELRKEVKARAQLQLFETWEKRKDAPRKSEGFPVTKVTFTPHFLGLLQSLDKETQEIVTIVKNDSELEKFIGSDTTALMKNIKNFRGKVGRLEVGCQHFL